VLLYRAVLALFVVALVGCSGFVKNAEVVLQTAPTAYDTAMTFAEQNKTQLSHETLLKFETVRVQFPPAYRAFDSALATYIKSGSKDPADVKVLMDEVNRLIGQLQLLCVLNGGPNLGAKK
jgi:hypothetical protein